MYCLLVAILHTERIKVKVFQLIMPEKLLFLRIFTAKKKSRKRFVELKVKV